MSDVRRPATDCPDAETLAAFMDGRASATERTKVERHLAECDDCCETWMEAMEATGTTQPIVDASASKSPRGYWLTGAGLLAASLLAVTWLWPMLTKDDAARALDDLRAAVGTTRFTEARLSADFVWGETPSATRGAGNEIAVPLQQAALTASTVADAQPTARASRVAATGHLVLGRFDAAIRTLETALEREADADMPSDERGLLHLDLAAALLERFRARQVPTDAANALEAAEIAVRLVGNTPPALFNRALALEATGRLEDAVAAWDTYLTHDAASRWAEEATDRRARLQARIGGPPLTDISTLSPDIVAAVAADEPWRLLAFIDRVVIPAWRDAAAVGGSTSLDDGRRAADALRAAGRDAWAADFLQSLHSLEASARPGVGAALRLLQEAQASFDRSAYAQASTRAAQAAAQLTAHGVPSLDAEMLSAFADYFRELREDAVARGTRLARVAEPRGYLRIAGRAAYMEGQLLAGQVDLGAAIETLDRAVMLYTRAGDRAQVAATYSQLMFTAASAGLTDDAWRYMFDSTLALNTLAAPRLRYLVLSNVLYRLRDVRLLNAAVALGHTVQSLADDLNDPVYASDVALLQAGLHQRLGDEDGVRRLDTIARHHVALLESPETRAQHEHGLDFILARTFHTSDPQTALPALDRIIARQDTLSRPLLMAEALHLRGLAHAAAGVHEAAEADWERGLAVVEHERDVLKEPHLVIPRADRQWNLYASLIAHHADDPVRALAVAERARAQAVLTSGGSRPRTDDGMSLDWLPSDMTVCAYAVIGNALAVWTIRDGAIELEQRRLPPGGIERAVDRFVESVRGQHSHDDGRLATLLFSGTLPAGGRLVIIPDGPLHRVPFAALRLSDGRRLVAHADVSVAPSLAWLRRSLAHAPAPEPRALLVGVDAARPEWGLQALPRVADEIRDIERVHAGRVTTMVGAGATADAVTRQFAAHGVIHIAGHAMADERRPWESRIFLAPTAGRPDLTVSDLAGVRLQPGTLVVLSACSTAAGTVFRGEGVVSLARPFLAAGASAVLASLWPVRDDDAARTMVAVHRELSRGASLGRALAIVQREALMMHPDRWQPWVVLGA